MKVVICAAGSGSRWNNYLGTRKHLAPIDGVPLLVRTVGQLLERGLHDITIYCNPEHVYEIPGAVTVVGGYHPSAAAARALTSDSWNAYGQTLLMLGDVYYTDETIRIMTTPITGWHQYGRLQPSTATGKPGAEMFGWQFGPEDQAEFIEACWTVAHATEKTHVDWSTYSVMTGHDISTPPDQIRDWGRHVEIADDGTDDFDFPDDYERFMGVYFHRSGRRVTQLDFFQPWFYERTKELNAARKLHRKLWEHCSIAQVYKDRIGSGGRALGFGVGKEGLPAWLAARGCQVVATDRPDAGVWLERQHARSAEELRFDGICDQDLFRENVRYEAADMNAIPQAYHGQFDFVWSSSCFEHLGSIEHGLRFFLEQLKCLKPGGIAAHTTEYQWEGRQCESTDLSLFQAQHLQSLMHRVKQQGDRLWPVDLTPGDLPADVYVDVPPYHMEPHLNLSIGPFKFTSVLLIATRGI